MKKKEETIAEAQSIKRKDHQSQKSQTLSEEENNLLHLHPKFQVEKKITIKIPVKMQTLNEESPIYLHNYKKNYK